MQNEVSRLLSEPVLKVEIVELIFISEDKVKMYLHDTLFEWASKIPKWLL